MAIIGVKRGDSLQIDGTRTDSAGQAEPLSGVTVEAEMVRGSTRQALTGSVVSAAAGTFRLTLGASTTAGLAVGSWDCDVQFTAGGVVASSETFQIVIVQDVTGAA